MKFFKTRDVNSPRKNNTTDAGYDFFIPNDYTGPTSINTGSSVLIPSGIKANIPNGFMFTAFNKSGVASKLGLLVGAQVCDSGYQGEIHINLHNVSHNIVKLEPGQKIVQFILTPISSDSDSEMVNSLEELYGDVVSERGEKGFGSSDSK